MNQDNNKEMFPVVDEEGNIIGAATRGECHNGSKLLHPVVHLHVFNSRGELYLQKRPEWKDIQPGKWDTAVGGHVDLGESVEQALQREVREELGITDFTSQQVTHYVFESARERELVFTYKTVYDGVIRPSDELDGGRFWTMDEIKSNLGKGVFTPNFEGEVEKFRRTPYFRWSMYRRETFLLGKSFHYFDDFLSDGISFLLCVRFTVYANDGFRIALAQVYPFVGEVYLHTIDVVDFFILIKFLHFGKDGVNIRVRCQVDSVLAHEVSGICGAQFANFFAFVCQVAQEESDTYQCVTSVVTGGIDDSSVAFTANDGSWQRQSTLGRTCGLRHARRGLN